MVFEAIGVLLAAVVQGQFVNAHRMAGDCEDGDTTPSPDQLDKQVHNEHFPGEGWGPTICRGTGTVRQCPPYGRGL